MIHLYGDSHARFCFSNLKYQHIDHSWSSITMFRIGRDNIIANYNPCDINQCDVVVLCCGEVDCRCHIQRQIDAGRNEDDIINELVGNYFKTLKTNLLNNITVIILGIMPPVRRNVIEELHGPIEWAYPYVGTDTDRIRYMNKVNRLLEEFATINNYNYFNPYSNYTESDGSLNIKYSDGSVHLKDNAVFLEEFYKLFV